MSQVDCIFQSFQGAGSIYISSASSLTTEHLKKHTTRALLQIAPKNKLKKQNVKIALLQHCFIKNDEESDKALCDLFYKASEFMISGRKTTNIMIWCPQNRQLAITFAFAHLIIRYGYKLDYIWRIYDQRILNINLKPHYIRQLQDLPKKEQVVQKIDQKMYSSVIEKRIQRVKNSYSLLSKDSQKISKDKKSQIIPKNPQISSKKGYSETDYIESCQSQPSSTHRNKSSSTYSETKNKRGNLFNLQLF